MDCQTNQVMPFLHDKRVLSMGVFGRMGPGGIPTISICIIFTKTHNNFDEENVKYDAVTSVNMDIKKLY